MGHHCRCASDRGTRFPRHSCCQEAARWTYPVHSTVAASSSQFLLFLLMECLPSLPWLLSGRSAATRYRKRSLGWEGVNVPFHPSTLGVVCLWAYREGTCNGPARGSSNSCSRLLRSQHKRGKVGQPWAYQRHQGPVTCSSTAIPNSGIRGPREPRHRSSCWTSLKRIWVGQPVAHQGYLGACVQQCSCWYTAGLG